MPASSRTSGLARRLPAWIWPSAEDPGVVHPTLLKTGLALAYSFIAMLFLPDNIYSVLRFVIHPLAVLWLLIAIPKMSGRLRFSFPFYILLLLQVWMVISMLMTQDVVAKPVITGAYLWFPLEVGMMYVLAIGLGALTPLASKYLTNFFLVLCTLSGVIAVLQALHVGPAISIANFYVYRSIEGWDNISGIRASGLASDPNTNIMSMLVAAGLIAYRSMQQRMRWFHYVMWGIFISSSFFAQHRSSMPLVGLTFVVTTLIIFRRRPVAMCTAFSVAVLAFVLAASVFKHNFAYTFETNWSSNAPQLQSRLFEENKADDVFRQFPVTGIGPSPGPESFSIRPTNEYDFKVENLYSAIRLTLGVPGNVLVLTFYVGALVLGLVYSLNRRLPRDTRVLMFMGAIGAFNLIWNGQVKVNLTEYHVMFTYLLLLALAQMAVTPRSGPRRIRVSPYLQPQDRTSDQLVRY